MTGWLINHWMYFVIPLLFFLAIAVIGLSVRLIIRHFVKKQKQKVGWIQNYVIDTIWHPILYWFLLLGIYIAIQISILSTTVKKIVGQGIASFFVFSLMWVAVNISERLIRFYLGKVETRRPLTLLAINVVRVVVALVGILTIFGIWGAPMEPIIIVLMAILFLIGLVLRNNINNLLAWVEIIYGEHIKIGQFIKLGSGEAGHVTQIFWTKTIIKTDEGNLVIIPNGKLTANTIVNYGATSTESTVKDVNKDHAGLLKPLNILTDRELEVLKLIANGATNREIAKKLVISEHTVKSHIRSILNKLNIRNRQQAAVYAEREGLTSGINAI